MEGDVVSIERGGVVSVNGIRAFAKRHSPDGREVRTQLLVGKHRT